MSQRKIRGVLPTDPELAPGLLVFIPDINLMMDAAYAHRVGREPPQSRDPRVRVLPERTITPPGEDTLAVRMIPLGLGEEVQRRREPANQSLAVFNSLGKGCYGIAEARQGMEEVRGVPLSVCTSEGALALLRKKLEQAPNAQDPELRGFGWTRAQSNEFIDDFVYPYILETNGFLFEGEAPPLGADVIGTEDARILGITELARKRFSDRDVQPVVVTRDRKFIEDCNNPSSRNRMGLPHSTGVLSPLDYTREEKVYSLQLRQLRQREWERQQSQATPDPNSKAVRPGTPGGIPGAPPGHRIDPRAVRKAPNPLLMPKQIPRRRGGP